MMIEAWSSDTMIEAWSSGMIEACSSDMIKACTSEMMTSRSEGGLLHSAWHLIGEVKSRESVAKQIWCSS